MKPKIDLNTVALTSIRFDVGKEIFHVVGLGTDGKIAFRRKIKRLALKEVFEKLPPCVVGVSTQTCRAMHKVAVDIRTIPR